VDTIKDKPDLIVADSQKDGMHPNALGKIIDFGMGMLIYVSCKLTTLVII
jgi:tRNA/tmRNA/rRNA uracil-C5-methylase (TrmA/RlmC/RlmD family)